MKILHVNDVASVGSILVRASGGRDALHQPYLRKDFGEGRRGSAMLAAGRLLDAAHIKLELVRGRFTNLHVHYATFAPLAELSRTPYSLHVHGADILLDPHAGGLKGRLSILGIERATKIVVSTPDLLAPTRALRPDAIYIPNPMELAPLAAERPRGARPRAIVLSKMDPLKGWDRQVEIVRALVRALPELELRFFEHGQLPDAERLRLSSELRGIGAEPQPRLPRSDFLAALARYDFAIGQMEVGSLGMSELEALAAGVPTVADARAHEAVGLLPPVIRPDEVVARLCALWSDDARRRALGVAGREYVRDVHDPRRALTLLEGHLRS